jgi:hypothetical protein
MVWASTGCVYYRSPVTVSNPDDSANQHFIGIVRELQAAPVVNVLIIHGMGTHDNTYADEFVRRLGSVAGLDLQSGPALVDKLVSPYGAYSTVHRTTFRSRDGHELRVFVLTWSKLTEAFEDALLSYDWQQYSRGRVLVNRRLKKDLIDTAFDDAVVYSGTFAPALRSTVRRAVCVVLSNKQRPDLPCTAGDVIGANGESLIAQPPIFAVTHSLGSAMLIDTLGEMLGECVPSADKCPQRQEDLRTAGLSEEFTKQLRGVFLLANQLPLIYLSRIPLNPTTSVTEESATSSTTHSETIDSSDFSAATAFAATITGIAKILGERRKPIPIIAFNDVNDLLTFPVPAGWRDRITPGAGTKLQVVNISVTNAPAKWLAVAANPSRAHTTYWTNSDVIRFIANGN